MPALAIMVPPFILKKDCIAIISFKGLDKGTLFLGLKPNAGKHLQNHSNFLWPPNLKRININHSLVHASILICRATRIYGERYS